MLVDALTPTMPERIVRPLPADYDPTDWATDEELEALTAQVRARSK